MAGRSLCDVVVLAAAAVVGLLQGGVVAAGANPMITTLGAGAALSGSGAPTGNRTIRLETDACQLGSGRSAAGDPHPGDRVHRIDGARGTAPVEDAYRAGDAARRGEPVRRVRSTGLRGAGPALAFVITGSGGRRHRGIRVASQRAGIVNEFPSLNIDVIRGGVRRHGREGGDVSMWRPRWGLLHRSPADPYCLRHYRFGVRDVIVGMAVLVGVAATPRSGGGTHDRRRDRLRRSETAPRFLLAAIVLAAVSLYNFNFLTESNIFTVMEGFAFVGLVALGVGITIIAGEFDLSVGSLAAVAGILALQMSGLPLVLAVLVTVITGIFGAVQGFLIDKLGISSLVFTVGTLIGLRGLAFILSDEKTVIAEDVALGDPLRSSTSSSARSASSRSRCSSCWGSS